jgi:hypothetical protein
MDTNEDQDEPETLRSCYAWVLHEEKKRRTSMAWQVGDKCI